MIDTTVSYDKPFMSKVFILLINQAIEMKDLDHHLLCPMQCCINNVVIDEALKFLAPIPSETMFAIQNNNLLMPSNQQLFLCSLLKSPVTFMWEYLLQRKLSIQVSLRLNLHEELHYSI